MAHWKSSLKGNNGRNRIGMKKCSKHLPVDWTRATARNSRATRAALATTVVVVAISVPVDALCIVCCVHWFALLGLLFFR